MKKKTLGHIYALFTILVWGSCFVLTKVMLTAYTPTQIIPLRMGLAYLTLWALRPKTMKLPWKDELMFILIGITGGSFYFFLQNTASAHTSAANVSILVSMSPILTVILAQLFSRKGEKLGKLVYIGAVVAIAGVVLVVLNGTLSFHLSPLGDLLALAAALMWAVYSILVKKYTERYDNFLVTRRVFLWAFLTSLPLVLLTDGLPSLTPLFTQPNILISWLFLGVFGNAVCFAIWNIAFKRLGVVVTNNYLYASPFVTVVVGWLLLVLLGPNRPIGAWGQAHFGLRLVMTWWSAVFATVVVAFPLMYRTARGAFESFDPTLAEAAATLGRSNIWIFWRVRMPYCRQGILAGTVLAFARALGEYGATSMIAGYTPGKTATIATTVYQLWRTNDEAGAMQWVLVDIVISAVVLLAVNLLERKQRQGGRHA